MFYALNNEVILLILIGMLHHRKNPEKVIKAYAYASAAKSEGAELLYFSPRAVNFEEKIINGYVYINGSWQKIQSPFPDVIYNTGSPVKLALSSEIVAKLKEEIPFTTNSIGNKMRVYKRLINAHEFSNYLIPSNYIHSTRSFFDFFNYYKKIVFKPVNGHKGQNIVFIERIRDEFHLLIGTENYTYTWDELRDFVRSTIREELYLVQPYINCKTKSGNAYDFRLHVQKNGEGKWVITQCYPRIAPEGSIISNISGGGATNYLVPFLKQEFDDEYYNIKRYLENFSLQLAAHMDEIQLNEFSESIDELGIDVGLDDSNKIWIYEVNWRPGSPPAFYLELDVVRNMIKYAIFLCNEYKEKNIILN
jgi:UDP-N-acetylmuramoyl-tripeptide--D-alanyl-D-alanine ligase